MKRSSSRSLLLAYYGDDFTGSTDVMESLARAGVPTVLFLEPPTEARLAAFPGLRAYGIAGGSRAMTPEQMQRELPPVFKRLKRSGAPIVHYKMCSTFDSSPSVGSIGQAIEIGRRVFGNVTTPLVVGAPVLCRYVAFGNLFARSGLSSAPVRLDRHPTMRCHPVTPMDEADLRLHLARQTTLPIALIDILALAALRNRGSDTVHSDSYILDSLLDPEMRKQHPIALFDTLYPEELEVIGRILAGTAEKRRPLFCVGSSGVEYALLAHWQKNGVLPRERSLPATARRPRGKRRRAAQIIAVSGSCSPVTDRQIDRAVTAGYVEVACEPHKLVDPALRAGAVRDALSRAAGALTSGQSIIFHTARGPDDPRRKAYDRAAKRLGTGDLEERRSSAGAALGAGLADILLEAICQCRTGRAVVCGGDTSTHVARALGIEALEFVAPVAPGGPLCRVYSKNPEVAACQFVFKGGQVGKDSFFLDVQSVALP